MPAPQQQLLGVAPLVDRIAAAEARLEALRARGGQLAPDAVDTWLAEAADVVATARQVAQAGDIFAQNATTMTATHQRESCAQCVKDRCVSARERRIAMVDYGAVLPEVLQQRLGADMFTP